MIAVTFVPILVAYWSIASITAPRKNEKARLPGRPIEEYLSFKHDTDKKKYRGNVKIPMWTLLEMYIDGEVEFKGDCLEILEYRHDWATFNFTFSLFKFFFLRMMPEVILHTRSQGASLSSNLFISPADSLKTRKRCENNMISVTISTSGSLAHV
jgi:hypothetical protein